MANYIKIFDDTVLKQSILQGYQAQRTNANLNSFTMGQLAFTRDTGRVFVGNHTSQKNQKDSKEIPGGILVGNKYLGLIDSKPLGHFSPNSLPLKYGELNISKNADGTDGELTEPGVLTAESVHRKDKNNKWSKDVDYMEQYDAYTGDYMFDVFNNALILFDKNISIKQENQPIYASQNGENAFIVDGEVTSGQETLNVTRRTKLFDNSVAAENKEGQKYTTRNADYPIYGQGYVIMRILEPDGTTLGYRDRIFDTNGEPKVGSSSESEWEWENWSHNLIELKSVPSRILINSMNPQNFYNDGSKINLQPIQKKVHGFMGAEKPFVLPSKILFKDLSQEDVMNNDDEAKTMLRESASNGYHTLSFDLSKKIQDDGTEIIKSQTKDDKVLSIDANDNVTISTPYRQRFSIKLYDGLVNYYTGSDKIDLTFENNENKRLALGFSTLGQADAQTRGSRNPWYTETKSKYYYTGNSFYDSKGLLQETETWDEAYYSIAKDKIEKYIFDKNTATNYLKTPVTICSKTVSINPVVFPETTQSSEIDPSFERHDDDSITYTKKSKSIKETKTQYIGNSSPICASFDYIIKNKVYGIFKELHDETPYVTETKTTTSTNTISEAIISSGIGSQIKDDGIIKLEENGNTLSLEYNNKNGNTTSLQLSLKENGQVTNINGSITRTYQDENSNTISFTTNIPESQSIISSETTQITTGDTETKWQPSDYNDIVQTIGNNILQDKQKPSKFFIIDGYNVNPSETNIFDGFDNYDNTVLYKTEWQISDSSTNTESDDGGAIRITQNDDDFVTTAPNPIKKVSQYTTDINKLLDAPYLISLENKSFTNEDNAQETTIITPQQGSSATYPIDKFMEIDANIKTIEISTNKDNERTIEVFNELLTSDSETLDEESKETVDSYVFKCYNSKTSEQDGSITSLSDFIEYGETRETKFGILTHEDSEVYFIVYYDDTNSTLKIRLLSNSDIFISYDQTPYYLTFTMNDGSKKVVKLGGTEDINDAVYIYESLNTKKDESFKNYIIKTMYVTSKGQTNEKNELIEEDGNVNFDEIETDTTDTETIVTLIGISPQTVSLNPLQKYETAPGKTYEDLFVLQSNDEQSDNILSKIKFSGDKELINQVEGENGETELEVTGDFKVLMVLNPTDAAQEWKPYVADSSYIYDQGQDDNGNPIITVYKSDGTTEVETIKLSPDYTADDSTNDTVQSIIGKIMGNSNDYIYKWISGDKGDEDNEVDINELLEKYDYDYWSLTTWSYKQTQFDYVLKKTPTYKKGYNYNEEKIIKEDTVVIPDHATSVILELIRKDNSNYDFSIIIPNDSLEGINYNAIETSSKEYTPSTHIYFDEYEKYKTLVYTTNKGITTFEVPLVRTNLNNSKMFSFTLWNIIPDTTKFEIKIKGYRV